MPSKEHGPLWLLHLIHRIPLGKPKRLLLDSLGTHVLIQGVLPLDEQHDGHGQDKQEHEPKRHPLQHLQRHPLLHQDARPLNMGRRMSQRARGLGRPDASSKNNHEPRPDSRVAPPSNKLLFLGERSTGRQLGQLLLDQLQGEHEDQAQGKQRRAGEEHLAEDLVLQIQPRQDHVLQLRDGAAGVAVVHDLGEQELGEVDDVLRLVRVVVAGGGQAGARVAVIAAHAKVTETDLHGRKRAVGGGGQGDDVEGGDGGCRGETAGEGEDEEEDGGDDEG